MNKRDELRVLVHSEREAQKAAFGGNRSSELSEAAEAKLAEVRRDASRYVELRLAHAILEREIEAYRIANQGPVLERASEVFRELTLGAYPSLQSDVDESGGARLVAIRTALRAGARGGEEDPLPLAAHVPVDGLSSGTRDQLFLALRLASLEVSLGRTESMPLIADDILVEFDEERSRAGLEALARLAEKNQILLFTHHAYLADQARELGSRVRVHEL
jgi:uncharacterized protein YhaN